MIENVGGIYYLECDICGKDSGIDFDDFMEVVNWKKNRDNGWISRKTNNQWEDVCDDCK